ncbi:MAG: hypothetical protein HC883_01420 [Bdellovibrionaceae bacterium]|nr:hypothetical protein [Pseudobdellovibrionaceae bacterium]
MTWADFLREIADKDHVTIVGPLLSRAHRPVMPTIYVDGGSDFRADGGSIPMVSVGDGDSASGRLDEVLPANKDYSDLAFVLRSLPAKVTNIDLIGFLGERRDHELANLGEVHQFLLTRLQRTTVRISSSHDRIVAFSQGKVSMDLRGIFSVMVFEPEAVKISGACEYPLTGDVILPVASSVGLSNCAFGLVDIESTKPCFVFISS